MSREKQIRQASIEYIVDEMNRNYAFEEGAKLVDNEHGKELLYAIQKTGERTKREIINKACELLTRMIWEVTYKDLEDNSVEHYDKMEFIEDFKKAMEAKE